jgi:hypothetical protein
MSTTGLLNCDNGKVLLNCTTGKALLSCGECVDTIVFDHFVFTTACVSSDVTFNTGKSYPYAVKLRLNGTATVDDWSTVNGVVWHETATSDFCFDSRTVNSQTFVDGYVLKENGTGDEIVIPPNTEIVFVIYDTLGLARRLIGTFCVYPAPPS